MMEAVTGHNGGYGFATHIVGFEVHSSLLHTGVNAIMEGAKLIDWANQRNVENQAKEPGELQALFNPPFTTCHVGTIEGGTANNITAKDCRFLMGFRVVPGENAAHWEQAYMDKVKVIEAGMQAIHPDACIDVIRAFDVPALAPEEDGQAEALVRSLTGDNGTHVVTYGTEAGQFQAAGYSAVICGPGNIAQAHQPNEFVSVAQFNAGHAFMVQLVERLAQ